MTWFLGVLFVIGMLILAVTKAATFTKKRKQAEKDKQWNDQLESLLQSLKKS